MEEQFSLDEVGLDETVEITTESRPIFLTVLCILTWVGSGFSVISALISSFTVSKSTKQLQEAGVNFEGLSNELDEAPHTGEAGEEIARNMVRGMGESMDSMIEWAPTLNWINIGVGLLCVLGAYLMWQLKKTGFYLYTAATVFAVIIPIVLMGSNLITLMSVIIGGLFGLIFIILYGVNLKHMK
jgi:hypothetical protein